MNSYRLQSSPAVNTPGLIKWMLNVYRTDPKIAVKILIETYTGLTITAANKLLSGKVTYTVDADGGVCFSA